MKPRGLNGCIQRMQQLQARVDMLTIRTQPKEVAPGPRPMGDFSAMLKDGFFPMNPMGSAFSRNIERAPGQILSLIQSAASKAGIDPALFEALVGRESSFDPNAVSIAGATGLAQLMPRTAESLGVTSIFDPEQNLNAGARYLAQMLRQFDGNKELALAAYNAGPGTVRQVNGVPPESAGYVRDVLKRAAEISAPTQP